MIGRRLVWTIAVAALCAPSVARAQAAATGAPAGRLEVTIGGGWFGGAALGDVEASLREPGGGQFQLFDVDRRFGGAGLVEARVGYALTRRYTVEARVGVARPEVRASISGDAEGAPPITVAERVAQYTVDGALIVALDRLRFGSAVPFVGAGAGYLRQLHEGRTLVEHGAAYHVGGGIRQPLIVRAGAFVDRVGLRGDARLYFLEGGVAGEGLSTHAAFSGGVFLSF